MDIYCFIHAFLAAIRQKHCLSGLHMDGEQDIHYLGNDDRTWQSHRLRGEMIRCVVFTSVGDTMNEAKPVQVMLCKDTR